MYRSTARKSPTAVHAPDSILGDELGGVGVDHVVDLHHLALLHQQLDDVDGTLGHAVGEIGDADELWNRDLADQLFLRFVAEIPDLTAVAAAERRGGALAHLVGVQRGDEGQAAAGFFGGYGGAGRTLRRRRGTGGSPAGSATDHPWSFVFFRLEHGTRTGRPATVLGFAEALLRDLAGLALGFVVVLAAIQSAWQRLSAGAGTKGERLYDWAYCELADLEADEDNEGLSGMWTRGLLIRRSLNDGELAFFSTWCRAGTPIETLVAVGKGSNTN